MTLFAGDLEPSKCDDGLSMGFLWRHSFSNVHARGLLQMKLQLVIEIGPVLARQEETQTSQEFLQHESS
jgi:hypothetical protein